MLPLLLPLAAAVPPEVRGVVDFALCNVGIADERHVKQIVGRTRRGEGDFEWQFGTSFCPFAGDDRASKGASPSSASSFRGQLRH